MTCNMLVEHRLSLGFERSHVQEPLICEMIRHCPDVIINIESLSVGPRDAGMQIGLIGKPIDVKHAEEFLKTLEVELRTVSRGDFNGPLPEPPKRRPQKTDSDQGVQRKVWLTIIGAERRQPFLWMISQAFDVTFKIMQSVTGDPVSIVSLLLWGSQSEVEASVGFLRDQGISVEYGEAGLSAPFEPTQ
ncbi:MAG: hypothetical protein O7F76_13970 [Planctomycetota bacterium]|nr:hypothetical protein [Planctomycetota bacterium]MCZ6699832.1 hypothetical protein [Planctomycetota bacterium]MCZ6817789.1 hypothetical protein [Planctomycetota bacterium]